MNLQSLETLRKPQLTDCFCTEIWNWPSHRFLQSSVYTEGVHLPLGQDMGIITLQLYAATSVSAYTVRLLEVV